MEPESEPPPPPPPNIGKPMQPSYSPTTIVHQPVGVVHVLPNNDFDQYAKNMCCPYCQAKIITDTSYTNGGMTWFMSCVICMAGGLGGCCLIPFFLDTCKDVVHSCPNCHQEVGLYKRL